MRRLSILAGLCFLVASTSGFAEPMPWRTNLYEATNHSRLVGKPLFVYAYDSI